MESNEIPTIPNLFKEHYMDLTYPELFQQCLKTNISLSEHDIRTEPLKKTGEIKQKAEDSSITELEESEHHHLS